MKRIMLAISILVCSLQLHAQDAIYKLEKGKAYKYLTEMTVAINQEVMGQTMNISVDGTLTNTLTVTDVLPNGNYQVNNGIESALITVEMPQGTQTIGNDLVGKIFKSELTPSGVVVSKDTLPKDINPQNAQIMHRVYETLPDISGAKGQKLAVGTSWSVTKSDTVEARGKMIRDSKAKYTVAEVTKLNEYDCVKINVEESTESNGTMSQQGMELTVSGSGSSKGVYYFAQNEGIFLKGEIEQNEEQTIMVPSQGNMRIPVTQATTMKIELVK